VGQTIAFRGLSCLAKTGRSTGVESPACLWGRAFSLPPGFCPASPPQPAECQLTRRDSLKIVLSAFTAVDRRLNMPFFGLFQLPLRSRREAESLAPRMAASAPPPPFFRSQKSQPQFPLISLTYNFEFQTPSLWPAIVGSHESLLSLPNWLCSFPAANSPPQPKEESPVTENWLRFVKSQLWDRPPGLSILAGLAAPAPARRSASQPPPELA
jgi:hypothetical protein